MEMVKKERDYLFDNYKVFLIFLVVIGHFIEPSYTNNGFLYTLKWFIFSFHMPAFIFISGYFSKRELPLKDLVWKLAVPYLVYEVIYYLLYTLILHKPTSLDLLCPKFSLWYILALFVWRAFTPYVKKIPCHMILAIAAGLLIGCSDIKDNFLSIPRILVYYPFFLAGIHFQKEMVQRLRDRTMRILSACGVLAFTAYLIFDPFHKAYLPKIFYGRYNYDFLGQTTEEGILWRLFCYVIGFGLTFAFLALISAKQGPFSYIGARTMGIYLFHGLVYSCLKGTPLLKNVDTLPESLLLVTCCAALTLFLSAPLFTAFTNKVSNLRLSSRKLPAAPHLPTAPKLPSPERRFQNPPRKYV